MTISAASPLNGARTAAVVFAAALGLSVLAGCAAQGKVKRAAVVSPETKAAIQHTLLDLKRGLGTKIWENVSGYYSQDDPLYFADLKARTEALWKQGQIVDLQMDLLKVKAEGKGYIAKVQWSRALLLKSGQISASSGKCRISFRKSGERFAVQRITGEAFL